VITILVPRRRLLVASLAASAGALTFGHRVAAQPRDVVRTPPQTLGPFYPDTPPADHDNDLTRVKGAAGTAAGEVSFVSGAVFDVGGRPLAGVRVEIWQCDANERYHHPRDRAEGRDPNFQGYGTFVTDATGGYRFRTIKPVPYPGRTPHIHYRLSGPQLAPFVTQMYIAGHPQNETDGLFRSISDRRQRDSLLAPFVRIAGTDEWTAKFDLVVAARAA
jgi:protocatechuate 3,4-dioxygenase beta subunit